MDNDFLYDSGLLDKLYVRDDGNYELHTFDAVKISKLFSLKELKDLLEFQLDYENYEGASVLKHAINIKEEQNE